LIEFNNNPAAIAVADYRLQDRHPPCDRDGRDGPLSGTPPRVAPELPRLAGR
jgi:hypothetical protein